MGIGILVTEVFMICSIWTSLYYQFSILCCIWQLRIDGDPLSVFYTTDSNYKAILTVRMPILPLIFRCLKSREFQVFLWQFYFPAGKIGLQKSMKSLHRRLTSLCWLCPNLLFSNSIIAMVIVVSLLCIRTLVIIIPRPIRRIKYRWVCKPVL